MIPHSCRDWSHVSFDAPGRFDITTGQSIDFEFTMHNEGAWTVAVDNGCPWFTHGGAKVVCPTGIGDRLKPGQSAHGVATFYARAYGDGGSWNPADPYDPIAPSTYYVHGMLRDQYVFDNVTGSNSRKVIGVAVFADTPKLTTAAAAGRTDAGARGVDDHRRDDAQRHRCSGVGLGLSRVQQPGAAHR